MQNLEEDFARLNTLLEEKHQQLLNTDKALTEAKGIIEQKGKEIAKLKAEASKHVEEATRVFKEKRDVERDLANALERQKAAQEDVQKLESLNDSLVNENKEFQEKVQDLAIENSKLKDDLDSTSREAETLSKNLQQKEKELEANREARRNNQKEIEKLSSLNTKISGENLNLNRALSEKESELERLKKQCEDTLRLLDTREEELVDLNKNMEGIENRLLDTEERLARTQRENDTIKTQYIKAKEEIISQKKLRDDELIKAHELEQEKKRLEREALNKDLEARSAKRELEKVHEDQAKLLEGHSQLSQELEALREHTGLLETQNFSVFFSSQKYNDEIQLHRELDKFIETDERVRTELNRKHRVDTIKSKNFEELQKSFTKVRTSRSPPKRGNISQSAYMSPYRISKYDKDLYQH
eukprot:TRINITY_DN91724_c0_g1_i1.p1 TRINITY_DN91724_c0_g1~~TRINITY_DN91724_c0_g1_i1.p1  ORF type:complete len:415 (+),score=92.32 TRINITY_DN91724_c0_g1_i1:381-1625(+)